MHLTQASIKNFRGIRKLDWRPPKDALKGWHVVLGDNGSGKTSLMRAIALCLLGPVEAGRAFPNPYWITQGQSESIMSIRAVGEPAYDPGSRSGPDNPYLVVAALRIRDIRGSVEVSAGKARSHVNETVWDQKGSGGWFSAGFGALRRLRGSSEALERLLEESGHLTNHMSLLFEDVALSTLEQWIINLDGESEEELSFARLSKWFNQLNVFPQVTRLVGRSKGDVLISIDGGSDIRLRDLSDGFQSIGVILFELVRRLSQSFNLSQLFNEDGTIAPSGLVLVDEIDAHLHPNWQQTIGNSLCQAFPKIQWIVSTHSPFIAHSSFTKSVLAMRPEDDAKPKTVSGAEYSRIVWGDIEEAYSTDAFGVSSIRSRESDELLRELAKFNWLELSRPLSDGERDRQSDLRTLFPDRSRILPQLLEEPS